MFLESRATILHALSLFFPLLLFFLRLPFITSPHNNNNFNIRKYIPNILYDKYFGAMAEAVWLSMLLPQACMLLFKDEHRERKEEYEWKITENRIHVFAVACHELAITIFPND